MYTKDEIKAMSYKDLQETALEFEKLFDMEIDRNIKKAELKKELLALLPKTEEPEPEKPTKKEQPAPIVDENANTPTPQGKKPLNVTEARNAIPYSAKDDWKNDPQVTLQVLAGKTFQYGAFPWHKPEIRYFEGNTFAVPELEAERLLKVCPPKTLSMV